MIFGTQNLFLPYKDYRTLSLNAHYLVVFKNPRDMSQINALARQAFASKPAFLTAVYYRKTSDRHSYLLLDFKQSTPELMRVRDSITTPWKTTVFVPTYKLKMKSPVVRPRQLRLLKKHLPLLRHMAKCSAKECRYIATGLSSEVIRVIAQIAINVMNKNLPIDETQAVQQLARYKTQLRAVTQPKTSLLKKRKVIEQEGGFLGALLGLAVPLISSLIGGLTKGG